MSSCADGGALPRAATGIQGLDEVTGGGLPLLRKKRNCS